MKYAPLFVLLLSGCSGITTQDVTLSPQPNHCQITEARPTMFSTLTLGVCWGANGEVIGFTGVDGQPSVSVPLAVLGAGATVGSAYLLGHGIVSAAKNIPRDISGKLQVEGGIDPVKVDVDVAGGVTADVDVTGDVTADVTGDIEFTEN